MTIDVKVDDTQLLARFDKPEKRIAYAVSNAINNTAKLIQAAEREHVQDTFTLRDPTSFGSTGDFLLRQAAVIKPFASPTQGRPYAEISVGQKPKLLLSDFEAGGARPTQSGHKSIAVPIIGGPARPSFQSAIPSAYRFGALNLRLTPRTSGKHKRRKGAKDELVRYGLEKTFQVPGVGVFQRVSKSETKLVYAFLKSEQLPRRLDFIDTAKGIADRWFGRLMDLEIQKTVAFQAGRS